MKNDNVISYVYRHQTALEGAVKNLMASGILPENMTLFLPTGKERPIGFINSNKRTDLTLADDAAVGAEAGVVAGSAVGLLAGLGALGISTGTVMLGGPLALTLTGLGIGGAFGSIAGALVGWGVTKNHKHFEQYFELGGVTLAINVADESEARKVKMILEQADMVIPTKLVEPIDMDVHDDVHSHDSSFLAQSQKDREVTNNISI